MDEIQLNVAITTNIASRCQSLEYNYSNNIPQNKEQNLIEDKSKSEIILKYLF